jgi:hypothetical protein
MFSGFRQARVVAQGDWKCMTTLTSGRALRMPEWNPISTLGFGPSISEPSAIAQSETSLGVTLAIQLREALTSKRSPSTRMEKLPLLQRIKPQAAAR